MGKKKKKLLQNHEVQRNKKFEDIESESERNKSNWSWRRWGRDSDVCVLVQQCHRGVKPPSISWPRAEFLLELQNHISPHSKTWSGSRIKSWTHDCMTRLKKKEPSTTLRLEEPPTNTQNAKFSDTESVSSNPSVNSTEIRRVHLCLPRPRLQWDAEASLKIKSTRWIFHHYPRFGRGRGLRGGAWTRLPPQLEVEKQL